MERLTVKVQLESDRMDVKAIPVQCDEENYVCVLEPSSDTWRHIIDFLSERANEELRRVMTVTDGTIHFPATA